MVLATVNGGRLVRNWVIFKVVILDHKSALQGLCPVTIINRQFLNTAQAARVSKKTGKLPAPKACTMIW